MTDASGTKAIFFSRFSICLNLNLAKFESIEDQYLFDISTVFEKLDLKIPCSKSTIYIGFCYIRKNYVTFHLNRIKMP